MVSGDDSPTVGGGEGLPDETLLSQHSDLKVIGPLLPALLHFPNVSSQGWLAGSPLSSVTTWPPGGQAGEAEGEM